MEKKVKTKKSALEIVFYVCSAIMLVYAAYMFYDSYVYVNEYASAYGASVADMGADAIKYIMASFLPYFGYAVIIFGVGSIYGKVAGKNEAVALVEKPVAYKVTLETAEEGQSECEACACGCEGECDEEECSCDEEQCGEDECCCACEAEANEDVQSELEEKYNFSPSER